MTNVFHDFCPTISIWNREERKQGVWDGELTIKFLRQHFAYGELVEWGTGGMCLRFLSIKTNLLTTEVRASLIFSSYTPTLPMSEFKFNNRQAAAAAAAAEEDIESKQRLVAIQKSLDVLTQQQNLLLTTQQTTLDKVIQVHDQVSIHSDILHRLVRDRSNEVWILRGLLLTFFGVVVLKIIF
jgi:hypothetical protein